MNHVKRSIVIPVEMADMLDHLSKRYDVSFTAMLRRIVREWACWRKGVGYVVLPVSKPERRMMKKLFTEKGVSFRLGSLQALRRGVGSFSQKNDCKCEVELNRNKKRAGCPKTTGPQRFTNLA